MHKNQHENFAPEKQQKRGKRTRFSQKRRNRVRFGCWRGWQRLGTDKTRCEKPKFEPKRTPFPCTTCKKKPGRNTVFPSGLWQGQKDLNPRHAVLEWMWKQRTESGEGTRLRRSTSQVTKRAVLVWCCQKKRVDRACFLPFVTE